jgi:hypothetical protein
MVDKQEVIVPAQPGYFFIVGDNETGKMLVREPIIAWAMNNHETHPEDAAWNTGHPVTAFTPYPITAGGRFAAPPYNSPKSRVHAIELPSDKGYYTIERNLSRRYHEDPGSFLS